MPEKVYLNFFILCAILSQGIVGTFLEENIGESSDVLVRGKRVINRLEGQDIPLRSGEIPYVVNIKRYNYMHCVGTILSLYTVITAADCVAEPNPVAYTVLSGSTYTYRGKEHNVTDRKFHGNRRSTELLMTGIALITVNPPFQYSITTSKIDLHVAPILPGMHGLISGWGTYVYESRRETAHPRRLRSITVPIMNHQDCVNAFRNFFEIKDQHICTYHEYKQCGETDAGAPLVINNRLAGVHLGIIYGERIHACNEKPNVFALLQHLEYGQWIRRNIVV